MMYIKWKHHFQPTPWLCRDSVVWKGCFNFSGESLITRYEWLPGVTPAREESVYPRHEWLGGGGGGVTDTYRHQWLGGSLEGGSESLRTKTCTGPKMDANLVPPDQKCLSKVVRLRQNHDQSPQQCWCSQCIWWSMVYAERSVYPAG